MVDLFQNLIDFIHPLYVNKTLESDLSFVTETWSAENNIVNNTPCVHHSVKAYHFRWPEDKDINMLQGEKFRRINPAIRKLF